MAGTPTVISARSPTLGKFRFGCKSESEIAFLRIWICSLAKRRPPFCGPDFRSGCQSQSENRPFRTCARRAPRGKS
eukprot:11173457-Lingulodinium_polyedra.AAC.1